MATYNVPGIRSMSRTYRIKFAFFEPEKENQKRKQKENRKHIVEFAYEIRYWITQSISG